MKNNNLPLASTGRMVSSFCFALLLVGMVFLQGCNNDDIDVTSEVTYLPLIEMNGSANVTTDCNDANYTDPGVVVTEGGNPIPFSENLISYYFGSTAIDGPDIYDIAYSAYNVDSIPGSAFRHVFVPPCNGDLVSNIAGVYTATSLRTSNGEIYENKDYVLIREMGGDQYGLSHAIGGFYDLGREYGYQYAAIGSVITVNNYATSDVSITDAHVPGFGINIIDFSSFNINPGAKQISWTGQGDFANSEFKVTLTQVQLQ